METTGVSYKRSTLGMATLGVKISLGTGGPKQLPAMPVHSSASEYSPLKSIHNKCIVFSFADMAGKIGLAIHQKNHEGR